MSQRNYDCPRTRNLKTQPTNSNRCPNSNKAPQTNITNRQRFPEFQPPFHTTFTSSPSSQQMPAWRSCEGQPGGCDDIEMFDENKDDELYGDDDDNECSVCDDEEEEFQEEIDCPYVEVTRSPRRASPTRPPVQTSSNPPQPGGRGYPQSQQNPARRNLKIVVPPPKPSGRNLPGKNSPSPRTSNTRNSGRNSREMSLCQECCKPKSSATSTCQCSKIAAETASKVLALCQSCCTKKLAEPKSQTPKVCPICNQKLIELKPQVNTCPSCARAIASQKKPPIVTCQRRTSATSSQTNQMRSSSSRTSKANKPKPKKAEEQEDDIAQKAKQDSINMLCVVISTVMLLATEASNLPESYRNWTIRYLRCIKNLQGQHPANVRKILKMITEDEELMKELEEECECPNSSAKNE